MSVFFTLANAGAPLIFFLFGTPLTLLVFAAIVFGEAYVATRIIGMTWERALLMSFVANLASTLIGAPLSWFVYLPNAASTEAAGYGAIFLTLAYFISVGVEWLVAHIFVKTEERPKMTRWSWRANLYTYEGILVLLLTVAVWDRLR